MPSKEMVVPILLSCAVLLITAVPSGLAQSSFCNQLVAEQNGKDCVCTDKNKLYDYREQDCVDETVMYTYTECGPNAAGTDCACEAGWVLDPDTGLCTEASMDQCPQASCGSDEVCVDLPGRSYCRCNETRYRFSDGQCDTIEETVNPQWCDCPQGSYDITVGYTCICAEPFFIDLDGDGRNCVINSTAGLEDCSTDVTVCAMEDGDVAYNNTRAGFDDNGNDIDECSTLPNAFCWAHSHCVNLDGGQGYECQCDIGYTDQFFNTPIKECVLEEEPYCSGCECDDACSDMQCADGTVCTATTACSADCVQSLQQLALTALPSVALYTGAVAVQVPQFQYHTNHIALSLETVIGRDDVQVLRKDNGNFTFVVMTQSAHMEGREAKEVRSLISDACLALVNSDLCQLPGGVVTANASISVVVEHSCTASSCLSDEHKCVDTNNGRYVCQCKTGGTGMYASNYIEICGDDNAGSTPQITATSSSVSHTVPATTANPSSSSSTPDLQKTVDELQDQLDDAENSKTVIAATLGSLLAVALIALAVLAWFYWKK